MTVRFSSRTSGRASVLIPPSVMAAFASGLSISVSVSPSSACASSGHDMISGILYGRVDRLTGSGVSGRPQLPSLTWTARRIGCPAVLAGEHDVLPGQWGEVVEQFVRDVRSGGSEGGHRVFEVHGVPVHDRSDHKVQPAGAQALL